MSTYPNGPSRSLPESPNLRHLKDQAKDLLKSGAAASLSEAQLQIARLYGFASWPKLKGHVESFTQSGRLKDAIDTEDLARVKALMMRNPALHKAPLGYGNDGPLTWVAECRVPWGPPSATRLAIAEWMIRNGSDIHQGGDAPLMRAALNSDRIPMMELLATNGADVNALWHGNYPIIFASCEALDAKALHWLLIQGANPNCAGHGFQYSGHSYEGTALDYLIAGYVRSPERLRACIEVLLNAGGETRFRIPAFVAILRGRLDELKHLMDEEPNLVNRRFPELDCGQTGGRSLLLTGATLLHAAAEFGDVAAAALLLDRGADVNARADVAPDGIGGQTPIFHALTQFDDFGLPVARLLIGRGADLNVRAKLPGAYERPGEIVECTPLEYSRLFGGADNLSAT
jgi:ankyrin repeat protein